MTDVAEHRARCAIVGIGQTELSSDAGVSTLDLAVRACVQAIEDAGMNVADIDGIIRYEIDKVREQELMHTLGLGSVTYWGSSGAGGAAPGGMIGQAVGAIMSGQATAILCYRSLRGRSAARLGSGRAGGSRIVGGREGGSDSARPYDEFFMPYGLMTPGQGMAMITQRHMIQFGTTRSQLGMVAVNSRARAASNPASGLGHKPLALETYLEAPMISSPLCIFDYCLETDGAGAFVVVSTERAKDMKAPAAVIRAVAQSGMPDIQPQAIAPAILRPDATKMPATYVARELYSRAGLGPNDVQVAEFYDAFTIMPILALESYGFCTEGEGGAFVEDGGIDIAGPLPTNTAGGHLSEGYLHGMNHLLEGVRQIRGTSHCQVEGAEVALATFGLPVASSAVILTRS